MLGFATDANAKVTAVISNAVLSPLESGLSAITEDSTKSPAIQFKRLAVFLVRVYPKPRMYLTFSYGPAVRKLVDGVLLCLAAGVRGQDDLDKASKQADAELTAAYKLCLARFPPYLKEQLRIAERAWIVFSDKDEAAAAFAGKRRGLSDDDLGRESLNEVNARTQELRSFFLLPNKDLPWCQQEWQQADAQLTEVYQTLTRSFAPDEQEKVREAERA